MTIEDAKDDIEQVAGRAKRWLRSFQKAYIWAMPWSVYITLAIIAGVFFYWFFYQGTSELEKQAEDARTETVINDANTSVEANRVERSTERVGEAEKVSRRAQDRAVEAREKPKANVNIQEALDNCEKVYPGECK